MYRRGVGYGRDGQRMAGGREEKDHGVLEGTGEIDVRRSKKGAFRMMDSFRDEEVMRHTDGAGAAPAAAALGVGGFQWMQRAD